MAFDFGAHRRRRADDRRVDGERALERLGEPDGHRVELTPEARQAVVPGLVGRARAGGRLGVGLGHEHVALDAHHRRPLARFLAPRLEVALDDLFHPSVRCGPDDVDAARGGRGRALR